MGSNVKKLKFKRYRDLEKVTGKWLKEAFEWLWSHEDQGGCYHLPFAYSANHEICVCVGWTKVDVDDGPGEPFKVGNSTIYPHKSHEEWKTAWKIGWQTFNNGMQTDLDIDFEMPYNTKEYCDRMNAKLTDEERKRGDRYCEGEVFNTEEVIELKPGKKTPVGYRTWNDLAMYVRKMARKVAAFAKEVDLEEQHD